MAILILKLNISPKIPFPRRKNKFHVKLESAKIDSKVRNEQEQSPCSSCVKHGSKKKKSQVVDHGYFISHLPNISEVRMEHKWAKLLPFPRTGEFSR